MKSNTIGFVLVLMSVFYAQIFTILHGKIWGNDYPYHHSSSNYTFIFTSTAECEAHKDCFNIIKYHRGFILV